jgi:hypothetical protein
MASGGESLHPHRRHWKGSFCWEGEKRWQVEGTTKPKEYSFLNRMGEAESCFGGNRWSRNRGKGEKRNKGQKNSQGTHLLIWLLGLRSLPSPLSCFVLKLSQPLSTLSPRSNLLRPLCVGPLWGLLTYCSHQGTRGLSLHQLCAFIFQIRKLRLMVSWQGRKRGRANPQLGLPDHSTEIAFPTLFLLISKKQCSSNFSINTSGWFVDTQIPRAFCFPDF